MITVITRRKNLENCLRVLVSRALKKTISYSISGNIKFGFSDGSQPLPVEKIQSKWDLENVPRAALELNSTQLDDVVPTSKAVSWPKVRN